MKRVVLFVDDEARLLDGLRVRLHRQRAKWEMVFATSGAEALAVLAARPVDVIVTDMRMPEMDGAMLLNRVQQEYPGVVRIALSGHSEEDSALRAMAVTHQFLSKPCEAGLLESVVERACQLQELIGQEAVRRVIGRVRRLPSLPRLYLELREALRDEECSTQRVARLLRQDMAMCAKVLQIVNSSFFGLARTISEPEEAVMYLGFEALRHVVLAAEVFRSGGAGGRPVALIEEMQQHAVRVANLAAGLFADKRQRDRAYVAGLLHDIGKLVLALELPEVLSEAQRVAAERRCPRHEAEEELLGVSHAEIGGYLLGLWGLPHEIVEAVANHHHPQRVASLELDTLAATYVANLLVRERTPGRIGTGEAPDAEYLQRLGLAGSVAEWRERAQRQTGA